MPAPVRGRLAVEARAQYEAAGPGFLGGAADVGPAAGPLHLAGAPRPVFDVTAAVHGQPFAVAARTESSTPHVERVGSGSRLDPERDELRRPLELCALEDHTHGSDCDTEAGWDPHRTALGRFRCAAMPRAGID